jgi:hypothetical protein
MGGQGQRIALWLVAVLGVVLGGAALVLGQSGRQTDLVTTAQLESRAGTVEAAIEERIAELTADADGATPVVNAAQLNGLTSDQFARAEAAGSRYFSCQDEAGPPGHRGRGLLRLPRLPARRRDHHGAAGARP